MSLEAVSKFKFVSPGVFIDEIDQSQLPKLPARMGPVIIGRAERGPGLRPVLLQSFSDYVEIFGNPIAGGKYNDTWRNGNYSAPTYAAYAAQAYLRHSNPVTFVRLVGTQHDQPDSTGDNAHQQSAKAGWATANAVGTAATDGGAYGLFVIPSGSLGTRSTATIICDDGDDTADDFAEGEHVKITSQDGTVGIYILSNAAEVGAVASGTVLESASDLGSGTPDADLLAAGTCIAVRCNLNTNSQAVVLNEFKDTIQSTNSPLKGKITDDGSVATTSGAKTMTFTEAAYGAAANTITTDISQFTVSGFSGGTQGAQELFTGSLAAVWYLEQGTVELTGTLRGTEDAGTPTEVSGTSVMVKNISTGASGQDNEWKVIVKDGSANKIIESSFNFNPNSDKYIRKVFNTEPQLVNDQVFSNADGRMTYWLGDTYERAVADSLGAETTCWGTIVALSSGSAEYSDMKKPYLASETGWFFSQDLVSDFEDFDPTNGSRTKKLFKFISIDCGSEWNQNNLKISIENVKPGKSKKNWPTFTVAIRKIEDTDKKLKVVEKYSNVNLDPTSPDYISRRIGSRYVTHDANTRSYKTHGDYPNISRWVRVEVRKGITREEYPFGVYGPWKFGGFTAVSGVAVTHVNAADPTFIEAGPAKTAQAFGWTKENGVGRAKNDMIFCGQHSMTASFEFPSLPLRKSGSDGGVVDQTKAYWGVDLSLSGTYTAFDRSNLDVIRNKPLQDSTSDFDRAAEAFAEYSWIFTLDDIAYDDVAEGWFYKSGSRAAGTSYTSKAGSGSAKLLTGSTAGINKFTTVLYGGFDGLDITEREPFRNTYLSEGTEQTNYAYHTLIRAIDHVRDAEKVECNLMAMPGITDPNITKELVETCEERADALAIIDIQKDYAPDTEHTSTTTEATAMGDLDQAVAKMKDRDLDSSYACCYYPWVQIRDSIDGSSLWVPPSVVALGSMAYTESRKDVWFAPAGFARGGLTETDAGGVKVTGVRQDLTSKERDKLYDVGINPIASFPAEGIVIFGQKTLQNVKSALDRINVRRLLIFLKKEISRIASRTLFEQNVQETWNAFSGEVDTLLSAVQTRLGLTDYRLILDETTTTPELVDRNILYAKIYLKPARAIEFIALDFIITSSGASFED